MLTKHVSTIVDTKVDEQVVCPQCRKLVPKNNLVPTNSGNVCVACYKTHQGA